MSFHFVRFALQSFRSQKRYLAITVAGLSLALGAGLLVLSFVNHELSFEDCHEHAPRIYRLSGTYTEGDLCRFLATAAYPLGPALRQAVPEVEEQVRIRRLENVLVRADHDRAVKEPKFLFTDPEVFDVFSVPFARGDAGSALNRPSSVVISEKVARDLFVGVDPIGKTITVMDSVELTVTGVMADIPLTTQIHTNFLASLSTLERTGEDLTSWGGPRSGGAFTFLMLAEGASPVRIEEKLPGILAGSLGEEADKYELHLQPLKDMYFNSGLIENLGPSGSLNDVYLFAGVGLILLLLACFNYINLTTARIFHRRREVMVRTVVGADRGQLVLQFLSESILLVGVAMVIGLAFYELSLPYLEAYIGRTLGLDLLHNDFVWLAVPALVLAVGVLSGVYPAYVMSRKGPKGLLVNGRSVGSMKSRLRRTLVIVQASLAIALVGFTLGIHRQLDFTRTIDLGFDPENIVLLKFGAEATQDQKVRLKHELRSAGLLQAALGTIAPGESALQITVAHKSGQDGAGGDLYFSTFMGDDDFASTFGLELHRGRWLSDPEMADLSGAALINESASRQLGLENEIGEVVSTSRGPLTVVGIVKDFHALSLHNQIMPAVITRSTTAGSFLAVRMPELDKAGATKSLQKAWEAVFPNDNFNFSMLADIMAGGYSQEKKLLSLFSIASGLAVFIACLGVLGLVSYMVERRTREIGIRKSLGASVASIGKLLSGELIVLVTVAGLVAFPFTTYAMGRWLEGFAYTIDYGWATFALAVAGVLMASVAAIGALVLKTARANPVDMLRCE